MIACVLSGTERGEVRVALRGWGCEAAALRSATEATQSPLSPHTEVIRPQEAEPDIADTRPPYHILPRYPPTPHDTTFLRWHPTRRGNRKGWFTYSDMGTEDVAGRSKQWKKVRKKAEISVCVGGGDTEKNACGDCFYCFPDSWSGGRRKQEQAMQPANFKPINCKWDNYCRCFILAAGITWFKSAAACCFWWVMCNVMFHIHLLYIRRRNHEEFISFEEKLLLHTWGENFTDVQFSHHQSSAL